MLCLLRQRVNASVMGKHIINNGKRGSLSVMAKGTCISVMGK